MFKKLLTILSLAALPAALCPLPGCGPFWVDPYIRVEPNQLDWVHIHYYNTNRKPIRRVSVYVAGTGLVEVKKGYSEQISNDFAKKYQDEDWDRMKTHRSMIDPEHVTNIFQDLVNSGLLDCEKNFRGSKKESFSRFIAVKARIGGQAYNDTANIFEVDPDLAEKLLDVVRQFENPSL